MEVDKPTMKFIWNSKGSSIANRLTLLLKKSVVWNLPHHKMRTEEKTEDKS